MAAAAVNTIREANRGKATEAKLRALRKRDEERMLEEMLNEGKDAEFAAKRKELTAEEKELYTKLRKFKRKRYIESWPKVKGYGHISPHCGRLLPYQVEMCQLYCTQTVTWFVAAVIVGNFLFIVVEKELDPYPSDDMKEHLKTWVIADIFSNVVFTIELFINYYGAGPRRFWTSGWNIFDFMVVAVGILTMTNVPLGPFALLKIFRAFRVFRLFKRIKSLNKIIVSLLFAIPGVMNAFIIQMIFMAIYAIIAVDYFRDFGGAYICEGENGTNCTADGTVYLTTPGNDVDQTFHHYNVSAETARGFLHGDEYYGTFFRAFYTLFQVLTGESWSEAIARPLIFGLNQSNAMGVAFYFVTFILLMQIVLVNVVVAVLLDKFVSDDGNDEEVDLDDEDAADGGGDGGHGFSAVVSDAKKASASEDGKKDDAPADSKTSDDDLYFQDVPKEIEGLQTAMAALQGKVDLIMKALEVEGKISSQ